MQAVGARPGAAPLIIQLRVSDYPRARSGLRFRTFCSKTPAYRGPCSCSGDIGNSTI